MFFVAIIFLLVVPSSSTHASQYCSSTLNRGDYAIYGGINKDKSCELSAATIDDINANQNINSINMSGFLNINTDITLSHPSSLVIGAYNNKNYLFNDINFNNFKVVGVKNLMIFDNYDTIIENANFINVGEVKINGGSQIDFTNVAFNNSLNDLNFKANNIGVINFYNVTFEGHNSNLIFNFNNLYQPMKISGDIILKGANARAVLNFGETNPPYMLGKKGYQYPAITIDGINSYISTSLNLYNLKDFIINHEVNFFTQNNKTYITNSIVNGGGFNFYEKNNTLYIINSLVNSNINFSGNQNIIKLNNVRLTQGRLNINSSNNLLTINNNFAGKITLNGVNNTANLNNVTFDVNSSLDFLGGDSVLNINNTLLSGKKSNLALKSVKINYHNQGHNTINIKKGSLKADFSFTGNNVNDFNLGADGNTYLSGNIYQEAGSILNFNIKGTHEVVLDYTGNFSVNNLTLNQNSVLKIGKSGLVVNNYRQNGDAILNISLNNLNKPIISGKEFHFNGNGLHLTFSNVNAFLKHLGDSKSYTILTSESEIVDLGDITALDGIFRYKVEKNGNSISITATKQQNIKDIANKGYNTSTSFFARQDIISMAEDLDNLWDITNNQDIINILDEIVNISNNPNNLITFLGELFPIANDIIYLVNENINDAFFDFTPELRKDDTSRWQFFTNYYDIKSNLLQRGVSSISNNLRGNGYLIGVNYLCSSNLNTGLIMAFNQVETAERFYGIKGQGINLSNYWNYKLLKLGFLNTKIGFSNNAYDLSRNVFMTNGKAVNLANTNITTFTATATIGVNLKADNKNYPINFIPYLSNTLSSSKMTDYEETGISALRVEGFRVNTFKSEAGVTTSKTYVINSSWVIPFINFSIGYRYNNLHNTNFKFVEAENHAPLRFTKFNGGKKYLKFSANLAYVTFLKKLRLTTGFSSKFLKDERSFSYNLEINYSL